MAISSHEMYLVLKVRDEGSRMLRAFGSEFSNLSATSMRAAQKQLMAGAALTTLGVAVAAAGVAGLMFFNDAINASMDYTQAAALTLTQVDKLGVSLEDVKNIGRRVANEVPIAFDNIQKGLYDIFSSMDVTIPQAENLLEELSKAAVSGAVDVSTAARATIGILNAYKLPASDVNKVNDVMFQLVRKGIGTYEEFTATIGRSIPSAVKAGQSYQSVAGMLAFLTRNNMSAAMSASAAARAMDAISKPKSIINLKNMGVAVADASGRFRPMVDIMTDLRGKLAGLTPVAKAAKLDQIFKGSGGTIQAMRFFNLATSKSGPLLNTMTTAMNKAKGAAAQAYNIMSNTPQAKIDMLNNRYKVMKTIVGDQLLPVKLKLIEALGGLLSWWNKLDPGMQKNIVIFMAVGAALSVLIGVILIITGIILMMSAAATMAGISFLVAFGWVALIVVGIIALIAVIVYLITHWDEVKAFTIKIWKIILNWLSQTWDAIKNKVVEVFNGIKNWLSQTWDAIKGKVIDAWNAIKNAIMTVVDAIKNWLSSAWDSVKNVIMTVWNFIVMVITTYINAVSNVITTAMNFIKGIWESVWGFFGPMVMAVWGAIVAIVNLGIAAVQFIIAWTMRGISVAWDWFWTGISTFVSDIWNTIYEAIAPKVTAVKNWIVNAWNTVKNFTTSIWNTITGFISGIWNTIYTWVAGKVASVVNYISSSWNIVKTTTSSIWNTIYTWIADKVSSIWQKIQDVWNTIKAITTAAWDAVKAVISTKINEALAFVSGIKDKVLGYLSGAKDWLLNAGEAIIRGLVDGITRGFHLIEEKINSVTSFIKDHMPGSPVKLGPLRVLNDGYAGKQIIKMLADGMSDLTPVTKALDELGNVTITPTIAPTAMGEFGDYYGRRPPSPPPSTSGTNEPTKKVNVKQYIYTQEINPVKHAADLGWEVARAM